MKKKTKNRKKNRRSLEKVIREHLLVKKVMFFVFKTKKMSLEIIFSYSDTKTGLTVFFIQKNHKR